MQLTIIKPSVNHIYNGQSESIELSDNRFDRKLKALHTIIATAKLARASSDSVRILCPIF